MRQKIERLERQVKATHKELHVYTLYKMYKSGLREGREGRDGRLMVEVKERKRGKGWNERKSNGGSEGERERTHRSVSTSL